MIVILFEIFQLTNDPESAYLLKKKSVTPKNGLEAIAFVSTKDGFESVRHGGYAFQCASLTAFPIIQDTYDPLEICDLNMLQFEQTVLAAFVVKKESPYHSILAAK